MAAQVTASAGPAAIIRQHFDTKFLQRLEMEDIVSPLLEQKIIPANSGDIVQFHRLQALALKTHALSGTLNASGAGQAWGNAHPSIHATAGQLRGTAFVVDSVPAQLELIGDDMQISELAILTMEPNPIPELTDVFMYNGVATFAQRNLNLMVSSYANGASNTSTVPSINYNGGSVSVGVVWGDGSATLTEATLDADSPTHRLAAESFNISTYYLRANKVPVLSQFGLYGSFVSNGQAADLRMDGTFQEIALKGTMRGENKFERALVGDLFGCRVMETPFVYGAAGTIDATNDEIHRGVVFGQGYAAKVSHKTGVGRPRFSLLMPSPSPADPYGNVAFLVWKAYAAGTVINPVAGRILKSATTNLRSTTGGDAGSWL